MTRSIIHLTLVALVIATSAHARTLEVGENKEFKMPSAAAAIAQDGDHVEIQPGEYFDCVVWSANKLVVEGIGDPDKVIVTDKTCQGKALFVTVGEGITIRNLTLTRARVPDGNGRASGAREKISWWTASTSLTIKMVFYPAPWAGR